MNCTTVDELHGQDGLVAARTDRLVYSVLTNERGALTKAAELGPDGKVTFGARAQLFDGEVEVASAADLSEFAIQLRQVSHRQAFAYGVTHLTRAKVVTRNSLHLHPGAVARDREHFRFRSGPGIWMLDHDDGKLPQRFDDAHSLRDALLTAVPALETAPMLWTPSASSYVFETESGAQLKGPAGARLYIPVREARDIPRAHRALQEALWAAGLGTFVVSKSGRLLERTLFDGATAQPERLDFVAGAKCRAPLEQRRPDPVVFESEVLGGVDPVFLDSLLPDPDREIRAAADANREVERKRIEPERQRVRQEYLAERIQSLVDRGVAPERAAAVIQDAIDQDQLFAEFLLYSEKSEPVTVGEVLDDPARWHGTRFADPLEPGYDNDTRIAYANLRGGGRPYIYSHAHGGKRYCLFRQPAVLDVVGGDSPRLADACVALLRLQHQVFDGPIDGMLRVGGDGRVYPASPAWLRDHLGRIAQFRRYDKRAKSFFPTGVPMDVVDAIQAREGQRGLPVLNAVVTAPTMRADGSVLDLPGYDDASGILYLSDALSVPKVPHSPSVPEAVAALLTFWGPVSQFPFDGPVSRGVALAALLTSVVRGGLPTAPAFAFDAPAAGTGKTLLARCVARLGGHLDQTAPLPGTEEERRKTIFAFLRSGSGCIVFDNVTGTLQGDAVDQALTSPMYRSRVLGEARDETVPNRALFLVTGNNVATAGDTNRRVLRCRIDAGVERPYTRAFEFNPADTIRDQRLQLVAAGLTMLRGYLKHAPRRGSLASFEEWDGLVRGCIQWLAEIQQQVTLGDPVLSIHDAEDGDTSKGTVAEFFAAWWVRYGDTAQTAGRVIAEARSEFEADLGQCLQAAVRAYSRRIVGEVDGAALGYWLRKQRGVVVGGYRLDQAGNDRSGSALWRVTRL